MTVIWITPFPPARDGIADYAAALRNALRGVVAVDVVDTRRVRTRSGSAAYLGWRPWTLWRNWRSSPPQLLHVQFAVSIYGPRLIVLLAHLGFARRQRVPVVVTAHEVSRDLQRLGPIGRSLYRTVLGGVQLCIVHNPAAAALLHEVSSVPTTVIPHAATPPAPSDTDPATLRRRHALGPGPVFLLLGFIHIDKGYELAIRALHLLNSAGGTDARAQIVVAGSVRRRDRAFRLFEYVDVRYRARLQKLVARLGLDSEVRFAGYVPDGEIAAWLRTADAILLPYRRAEDSGIANLALSAGTPIIASDLPALHDYTRPEWRFPVGDVAALARLMRTKAPGDTATWSVGLGNRSPASVAVRHAEVYRAVLAGGVRGNTGERVRPRREPVRR